MGGMEGGGGRGRGEDGEARRRDGEMGSDSEVEGEIEGREETMEQRSRRETLHCSLNELHPTATRR